MTAHSSGIVKHWELTSNQCLHTYSDHAEQVFALDYNDSGSQFVTAGRDGKIRIYDEDSKDELFCMQGGLLGDYTREAPGHSNRVFSVKFTHDEHILLSAGWDNTVQIWDTRSPGAVRSLHGVHICGDALDLKRNTILTGSWRERDALELWDFGSGERISSVPWQADPGDKPCMLYAAQFSKDSMGRFIVAGGSGQNEAKVFDHMAGDAEVGSVAIGGAVLSVDISPDGRSVAVAGSDKTIHILEIAKRRDYYL
jgi:WD40 repeat protein